MFSDSSGVPQCDLQISFSNLTGGWGSTQIYKKAISNWNTYARSRITITEASFATANVDLVTYAGEDWPYDETLYGFTVLTDTSGYTWSDGKLSNDDPVSSFGNRIDYASVIFNPNFDDGKQTGNESDSQAIMNLRKTMTHEIGHCVNIAHPYNSSIQCVMASGWNKSWSNYDVPQSYAGSALEDIYDTVYS